MLLLHDVENKTVENDIRTYLTIQLSRIVDNRSGVDLSFPRPTAREIGALVHKSGGLFIFASTACKFVVAQPGNLVNLLRLVIDPRTTRYEGPFGADPSTP